MVLVLRKEERESEREESGMETPSPSPLTLNYLRHLGSVPGILSPGLWGNKRLRSDRALSIQTLRASNNSLQNHKNQNFTEFPEFYGNSSKITKFHEIPRFRENSEFSQNRTPFCRHAENDSNSKGF
jgi:hypothetical protein